MAKKTEAEIRTYLNDFIQQAGHQSRFFADATKLDTIVKAGPQMLDDWRTWSTTTIPLLSLAVASKYELEMLKLALYDIRVVIDDSGSLTQESETIDTMRKIGKARVDLQTIFKTGGIQIHYLNSQDPSGPFTATGVFNTQWSTLKFGGPSKLGTTVRRVWTNIIANPSTFAKPNIIYIFTDGDPTGERDETLIDSLRDCKRELERNQYTASAIAFTIVQVGKDIPGRKFLETISNDTLLRDHVEVVMEEEDLESQFPDSRNPRQDQDYIVLRQFFGALNPKVVP